MRKLLLSLLCCALSLGIYAQNIAWSNHYNGGGLENVLELAVDDEDNQYIVHYFSGSIDADAGPGSSVFVSKGVQDILVAKEDPQGKLLWAKQIGGPESIGATAIVPDGLGNVYIAGQFGGTIDFDPGPDVFNLTGNVFADAFLLKLDDQGDFLWVKRLEGAGIEIFMDLKMDEDKNLYLTGWFDGVVDFDPGPAAAQFTANGQTDAFVMKLDENADFLWAKTFGGSGRDEASSLALDKGQNVLAFGNFSEQVDFDPGPGIVEFDAATYLNSFFLKLDKDGDYIWAKQLEGAGAQIPQGVSIDENDNIYATGHFVGAVDCDPGPADYPIQSVNGDRQLFVLRLDPLGNFEWAGQIGGTGPDGISRPSIRGDRIMIVGSFEGQADVDPTAADFKLVATNTSTDLFFIELNKAGELVEAKHFGGNGLDGAGSVVQCRNDVFYITGIFGETIAFDPNSSDHTYTAEDGEDGFLLKFGEKPNAIKELTNFTQLHAFPNPSSGQFTLDLDKQTKQVEVSIINIQGGEVYKKTYHQTNRIQLDLTLPTGIYWAKLTTDTGEIAVAEVLVR